MGSCRRSTPCVALKTTLVISLLPPSSFLHDSVSKLRSRTIFYSSPCGEMEYFSFSPQLFPGTWNVSRWDHKWSFWQSNSRQSKRGDSLSTKHTRDVVRGGNIASVEGLSILRISHSEPDHSENHSETFPSCTSVTCKLVLHCLPASPPLPCPAAQWWDWMTEPKTRQEGVGTDGGETERSERY